MCHFSRFTQTFNVGILTAGELRGNLPDDALRLQTDFLMSSTILSALYLKNFIRFSLIHPSIFYLLFMAGSRREPEPGDKSRPPSPQRHSPAHPGRLQGVPKPDRIYHSSTEFWVRPRVFYLCDMPGTPLSEASRMHPDQMNHLK